MDEIINLSTTLSVILQLGRVGENNANSIVFDFSDWQTEFGEGTVSLVCKRPTDAEGYPVSLTVSGTEATWLVSSTDVAYEGLGQAQISYTVGGVIKKSVIYMTRTCPSIEPVSSTPPDPYASWLDQMIEAKEDAEAARDEAVEAAGDLTEMAKTFPALLVTGSSSGSIATFDDGSETPVKSISVNIDPVQAGTGDPSPENVRPISGWDGVNVYVSGKNLLDVSVWSTTSSYNSLQLKVKSGYSYTMQSNIPLNIDGTDQGTIYAFKSGESASVTANGVYNGRPRTITPNADGIIEIRYYPRNFITDWNDWEIQLELGSTATAYEPYSGTVYPISLPSTVYGGVLDVGKGELTVDRAIIKPENMEIRRWNNNYPVFMIICSPVGSFVMGSVENKIANCLPTVNNTSLYNGGAYGVSEQNNGHIGLAVQGVDTLEDMQAWVVENNLQVCYVLRTPLTISLTPLEVRTILGYNNIYADSGNVDVVYYRDLDIVINKLLQQA